MFIQETEFIAFIMGFMGIAIYTIPLIVGAIFINMILYIFRR